MATETKIDITTTAGFVCCSGDGVGDGDGDGGGGDGDVDGENGPHWQM